MCCPSFRRLRVLWLCNGGRGERRGYAGVAVRRGHATGGRAWAVDGAGHYGAGLARSLSGRGETVLEIGRGPSRRAPAAVVKTTGSMRPVPPVRRSRARRSRCPGRGAPRGSPVLAACPSRRRRRPPPRPRSAPQRDRHRARAAPRRATRKLPQQRLIERCSRLLRRSSNAHHRTSSQQQLLALRTLARRVQAATGEAAELEPRDPRPRPPPRTPAPRRARRRPDRRRADHRCGPVILLDRVRSEAAFARLAGVAPLPASSGQTCATGSAEAATANSTERFTRSSSIDVSTARRPATTSHAATAEGKTRRDAIRLLKRYLARHLYRVVQSPTPTHHLTVIGASIGNARADRDYVA